MQERRGTWCYVPPVCVSPAEFFQPEEREHRQSGSRSRRPVRARRDEHLISRVAECHTARSSA